MKILVVRFSSIGDIVLTTPVVRCLKNQLNNTEIHYITKKGFRSILEHNPYINKLHLIEKNPNEIIHVLKAEKFDYVIDLHNNLRTLKLKTALGVPNKSFPKLNIEKWFLVNFKIDKMPNLHVVDRYFEPVHFLGVKNDHLPCDVFLGNTFVDLKKTFNLAENEFACFAIGAQFATKRMSIQKMIEVVNQIEKPLIILGGKEDFEMANELISKTTKQDIFNTCGKYNLLESAFIVKHAHCILTHDTGLMHIASSFSKRVISVWGNTVPKLGFYPYYPENSNLYTIHEVEDLNCRPCSKIGFQKCPKGHFNCMNLQNVAKISADVNH